MSGSLSGQKILDMGKKRYFFQKIKFLPVLSILYFSLVCFVTPVYSRNNSYPPDIKKILDRGVLRVGIIGSTNEFPFFFYDKNEKLIGMDIDMAEDLAKYLGVKLVLNRSSQTYQGVVDQVEKGEIDLGISVLSGTMSRAKKSSFSKPYIHLYEGLLVNRLKFSELKRKSNFFERIDTKQAVIGYLKDSAYEYFAKRIFKNATLRGYPYQKFLIQEVKKGNITAGLVDEKEIKTFALFNPNDILYIETVEIRDFQDPICIFVNYKNPHLLFFVNTYLDRRPKLGFVEIIQKYYEVGAHE